MNGSNPYANQSMVLLVEGKDEIEFFRAFLKKMGIAESVWVGGVGGKNRFKDQFPAALKIPGFKENVRSYAIVRDADDSAAATFDSVKGLLSKWGQPVPSQPATFTIGPPKVGVYIMPGRAESGMLESLCMNSVASHEIMPCVDAFMQCAEKHMGAPTNPHKAKAKCFLAGTFMDYPSVGVAALAGVWNFDHDCMGELRNFLNALQT